MGLITPPEDVAQPLQRDVICLLMHADSYSTGWEGNHDGHGMVTDGVALRAAAVPVVTEIPVVTGGCGGTGSAVILQLRR